MKPKGLTGSQRAISQMKACVYGILARSSQRTCDPGPLSPITESISLCKRLCISGLAAHIIRSHSIVVRSVSLPAPKSEDALLVRTSPAAQRGR
ncbi:hypothetical protein MTO96_006424 [Rhipicephalus appendiculatus]